MRIISGSHKGQNILTINDPKTRPMMSIAREGIFSSLQFHIENAMILDLYAGSGSMGIEALSRGAKYVTFVETSEKCIGILEKNLLNFDTNFKIQKMSVNNYISNAFDKYNIVFYDPPFNFEDSQIVDEISTLESLLEDSGYIICHRHIKSNVEILSKNLEIYKEKIYGQSRILLIGKI
tara:strand:+ start:2022 stop:2558 length:537 start_codon:yes stop_codon:yes gene_type:complete